MTVFASVITDGTMTHVVGIVEPRTATSTIQDATMRHAHDAAVKPSVALAMKLASGPTSLKVKRISDLNPLSGTQLCRLLYEHFDRCPRRLHH